MGKWFARTGVFALLIIICSLSSAALAQDEVSLLSKYLDQTAAANNLPTGDGNISPVEQSVASALIDGATGLNQSLTQFASSSPENAAWITQAQQNAQNYNQQMAANASAPVDIRAQIISDAVAQYGQDIPTVTQGTPDIRAQIISDAVAQYGQDIQTIQPSGGFDPRAAAISGAVAQYGQQLDQVQTPFDPRADAISKAVEQYGRSIEELNGKSGLSKQEQQSIRKTLKDTSKHYIDSTDSEYKELLQQHLQRLIDEQLEDLPIDWVWPTDGIWARKFGKATQSGDCSGTAAGKGDNGGPDRDYYDENDPEQQAQVCVSPSTGVVFLDGKTFRWDRNGQPNTYITETSIDSYDNSTRQSVMSVIDDYNIDVVTTLQSGTCTTTYVIHYKLVVDGIPFGCNAHPKIQDVGDKPNDQTPSDSTNNPDEIVEPIKSGEYSVAWLPFDSSCVASVQPTFNQMTVTPTSFDDVKLIVNGQTFSLFGDGKRGEFDAFEDHLNITLKRRLADDFNLVWQTTSQDNKQSCYAKGVAKLQTAAASQPNYQPHTQTNPSSGTNSGDSSSSSGSTGATTPAVTTPPPAGSYNITWTAIPGLECPAELKPKLPTFAQATVSDVADDHFVLQAGKDSYWIDRLPGTNQWMFTQSGDDNSIVMLAVSAVSGNTFSGTYTYYTADNKMCFMNIAGAQ